MISLFIVITCLAVGYWSNEAFKCYCGSFFIHSELSPFYGIIREDDKIFALWFLSGWYCTQKFHLDHLWEFWGLRLNIWAQLTPHNWNLTLTQITTDLLLIFFILTSTVIVPNKSKPKFKVIFLCQVLQCTILVNNSNPFVKVHCSVLFKSVVLFSLLTKHYPIF